MAFALIVVGALALACGGFAYTKETHTADLAPIQLSVDEKKHASVPIWVGTRRRAAGGVLLVVRVRS